MLLRNKGDSVSYCSPMLTIHRLAGSVVLGAAFCTGVFLTACTTDVQPIPEGVQTLSGVLLPMPISISRRGTHELVDNGVQKSLVESSKVNLRDFEGVDVVITGHFERNTDPKALPVLVASGVVLQVVEQRTWDVSSLGFSLVAPAAWNGRQTEKGMQFTQTGSSEVFLDVGSTSGTVLPAGDSIVIGGLRGVTYADAGSIAAYVVFNGRTMYFSLTPEINGKTYASAAEFRRFLQGVVFQKKSSSSTAAASSGSTTSAGIPCGGAAGILCPAGQYCEITDSATNIGRCRSVKR